MNIELFDSNFMRPIMNIIGHSLLNYGHIIGYYWLCPVCRQQVFFSLDHKIVIDLKNYI